MCQQKDYFIVCVIKSQKVLKFRILNFKIEIYLTKAPPCLPDQIKNCLLPIISSINLLSSLIVSVFRGIYS